jgi:hypothetical protein
MANAKLKKQLHRQIMAISTQIAAPPLGLARETSSRESKTGKSHSHSQCFRVCNFIGFKN